MHQTVDNRIDNPERIGHTVVIGRNGVNEMKTPTTKQIVAEILKSGQPARLAIRKSVFGICIENEDGMPLGGAFVDYEAAHAAHSKAWTKAWGSVPA